MSPSVGTDVVVAGEDGRHAAGFEACGMREEPFEPGELIGEFGPGPRVAVRQVEAADQDPVAGGLDVAGLAVARVARQTPPRLDRGLAAAQDRHAVVGPLAVAERGIADRFERRVGERGIGRFDLLEAYDVGASCPAATP